MKVFVCLFALVAVGSCGVLKSLVNSGLPAGPVHAAVGPLVATNRGWRDINLEGYSEDDNQDGQVDPVGQVAPVVYGAPYHYLHPFAAPAVLPQLKTIEVEAPEVKTVEVPAAPQVQLVAAPQQVVTYAHNPLVLPSPHVAYHVPAATSLVHHTVPVATHTYTYAHHPLFAPAFQPVAVASSDVAEDDSAIVEQA